MRGTESRSRKTLKGRQAWAGFWSVPPPWKGGGMQQRQEGRSPADAQTTDELRRSFLKSAGGGTMQGDSEGRPGCGEPAETFLSRNRPRTGEKGEGWKGNKAENELLPQT